MIAGKGVARVARSPSGVGASPLRRRCPRAPGWCPRPCGGPPASDRAPRHDRRRCPGARRSGEARTSGELDRRGIGADGQPGQETRSQRGRLGHRRDLDGTPDGVGQSLDEHVVVGHAAVDAERRDGEPAVALAGLDQIGSPVGHALEHGPDDLRAARAPGEADQRAAGAEVPDRGAQAEQRRHEPDVARSSRTGPPPSPTPSPSR